MSSEPVKPHNLSDDIPPVRAGDGLILEFKGGELTIYPDPMPPLPLDRWENDPEAA